MNGRTTRLVKFSALALPFVAIGLAQFIQGHEQWRQEDYFTEGNEASNSANFSDRTFSKLKDLGNKGSSSSSDSAPVAYHRSLHNVSWAVTIPLFSFLLPTANAGDPVNIASQASYGVFAAIVVIIGFAIPILFNGAIPNARSLENNKISLNHLLHPGHLMNLGTNFQNQMGIDPIQCLQKSVCEANRSPQNERYGVLAWPLQYFFPAKNISEEYGRSIYEVAATTGKYTRKDCRKKYDCMFDVLDLATYFLNMYNRAKEKVTAESVAADEFSDKFLFR